MTLEISMDQARNRFCPELIRLRSLDLQSPFFHLSIDLCLVGTSGHIIDVLKCKLAGWTNGSLPR